MDRYVVTVGNFDGIHLGHQKLLSDIREKAKSNNLKSKLVTFNPYPFEFFKHDKKRILSSLDKKEYLNNYGIDEVVEISFDESLRKLSPKNFFTNYLSKDTSILMVGEDFRFGKDRGGDVNFLKELCNVSGIEFNTLNDVSKNDKRVSSSWVREELQLGNFETVKTLLGRDYVITGRVLAGNQIGRRIETPTANINIDNFDFCFSGVFLCKTFYENRSYYAIANFGPKPTFNDYRQSLEINLFDFEGNLYDKELSVVFLCKIRDQIKFKSIEDLKKQIKADIEDAKNIIFRNE